MSYTREQIEQCAKDLRDESERGENSLFGSGDKAAAMLLQLLEENEALKADAERWRYARDNCCMRLDDGNTAFISESGCLIDAQWRIRNNERAIDAARASTPQAS